MQTRLLLAILLLAIAAPALAGDGHLRRYRDTGRYLSQRGIVGGRAVSPGSYYSTRRYDYGYRSHRHHAPRERIIVIEREYGRRRWR